MTILDSFEEVIGGVVDAFEDLAEALCVGSPENEDLVQVVVLFHVANVFADLGKVDTLVIAWQDVIGPVGLVGSDKLRIVYSGKGCNIFHAVFKLELEVDVEYLSPTHGLSHIGLRDVPAAHNEVLSFSHWENVLHWDVYLLVSGRTDLDRRALSDRAEEVGLLLAALGAPCHLLAVRNQTSGDGSTIVATKSDQHDTHTGDGSVGSELVLGDLGLHVHGVAFNDSLGAVVEVIRLDILLCKFAIRSLDLDVFWQRVHGYDDVKLIF